MPRPTPAADGPPRYIGTDRWCPRQRVYVAPQFVVWHPATDVGAVTAMLGDVAARNVAEAYRPDGVA